ncbi:SMP-30/gluconolactonase/LRE family protein [Oceanibacterium hippocampi]|uniref:Arylesterase n=1 Tax=Oceanibacterium hippocampi TaxID=745714 RepID=A0A1Y5TVY6_9PROT|nr:SMP-30/gluconolactonase/LRE family protein [Oceanibacterium hippocampi]SLN73525.1 Arylesterase [Oceanibacterium hippocampi]
MIRSLFVICVTLIALAVGFVIYTFWSAGQFRTIEPHFAGVCRAVQGITGAEDIVIAPGGEVAIISGDDRRAQMRGEAIKGGLYLYALDQPNAEPIRLDDGLGDDFHPHGIDLWVGPDGKARLFVVNHPEAGAEGTGYRHTVELFAFEDRKLRHLKTITGPSLISPNDIAATGPESFYATNDHGNPMGLLRLAEEYLQLPLSNVVRYDHGTFRIVADDLAYANGIALSKDGAEVYVAATVGRKINVYRRLADGGLRPAREYDAGTGVDNISVDSDGALWVAGHPQLLSFVGHSFNGNKLSPSEILELKKGASGAFVRDQVFLDAGDRLSGASVAVRDGTRLLVGAVFETRFLDCRLP